MFNSPVIVISPPRSGSTMTARVLTDWFGIVMDASPMQPHKVINPYGWYEDSRLVEMNNLFFSGTIKINAWTRRFKRYIRAMKKLNRPWGFKDPRIIPLLSYAITFFRSPTIVRCHRPKMWVVKSYQEKLGWEKKYAKQRYDRDESLLDKQLNNVVHYRIDFDRYFSEEEIIYFFQRAEVLRYAT